MSLAFFGQYAFTIKKILNESGTFLYFSVSTIFTILLMFNYSNEWVLVLNSFWLLPQIILNAWNGGKSKLLPKLLTTIMFNQIYSLYLLGCVDNVSML